MTCLNAVLLAQPTKAVLVRRVTADGITDVGDHVAVGDEYTVFPGTIREIVWGRAEDPSIEVRRLSIYVAADKHGRAGWMPLELLEVETDA